MDSQKTQRLLEKLKGTPVWWKDSITNTFFMEKPETIFCAVNDINLRIYSEELALVEHWLQDLGIDITEKDRYKYGGWHLECLFETGVFHLSFRYELQSDLEHGLYFEVTPDVWPCDAYEDCFGGICCGLPDPESIPD